MKLYFQDRTLCLSGNQDLTLDEGDAIYNNNNDNNNNHNNNNSNNNNPTNKYGPLTWELKQQYRGYEVIPHNIFIDMLGGWSRETETSYQVNVRTSGESSSRGHAKGSLVVIPKDSENFQGYDMKTLKINA